MLRGGLKTSELVQGRRHTAFIENGENRSCLTTLASLDGTVMALLKHSATFTALPP